jgi:LacI family transcriptional regulator
MFFNSDREAPVVVERMDGFCRAITRIGKVVTELVYSDYYRSGRLEGLIAKLGRDLKKLPKPLAVMAQYDVDANTVVRAAIETGLKVPEDIAVIGVDNDLVYSQLGLVPLTSVVSNIEEVGYRGAELLDRLMLGKNVSKSPIFVAPGGVVVRSSTDIFASDDPAISKALAFIAGNLDKPISVDDIVRSSGVCRRSLFSKFSERLGRSIHRELVRQRIARAKLKLCSSGNKLESIAAECGFSSYTALWSAFRAVEGVSPSEFKATEHPKHELS